MVTVVLLGMSHLRQTKYMRLIFVMLIFHSRFNGPFDHIMPSRSIYIEFSHNFNLEKMDNLERVSGITNSNFKMCLIGTIEIIHDMEIL